MCVKAQNCALGTVCVAVLAIFRGEWDEGLQGLLVDAEKPSLVHTIGTAMGHGAFDLTPSMIHASRFMMWQHFG